MKKLISAIVVLAMLVCTLTSCNILSGFFPDGTTASATDVTTAKPAPVREPYLDGNVTMSADFVYERPDYDKLSKDADALLARIKDGKDKGEDVDKAYENLEDAVTVAYSMDSINSVRQSEDVENKTYADEALWLSEQSSKLFVTLVAIDVAALDSPYRELLLEDITEDEIAYLRVMQKLADDEYVALSTEETNLENQYLAAESTVTVNIDGKDYTFSDLRNAGIMTEANKALWQDAYIDALATILLKMVEVRNKIAVKAGYANYADYAYDIVYERDYTPADAAVFAQTVKACFPELMMSNTYNYTQEEIDFINNKQYDGKIDFSIYNNDYRSYFESINPKMAEAFDYLLDNKYYSVGNEEKRQEGAFTTYISNHETPFVFMYLYNGYADISTFIHEFGHFYAYYVHGEDLDSDIDICELHSQMNEVLFSNTWKTLFKSFEARGVVKYQMHSMAYVVLSGCQQDEFQREIYTGKYKTTEDLNTLYARLNKEYGFSGYEDTYWAEVHHTFEYPFYYISYAVSAVPAISLYTLSRKEYDKAVSIYNDIIADGTDYTFCELLDKVGIASPFDPEKLAATATALKNAFAK